jgi:hypothetical protein
MQEIKVGTLIIQKRDSGGHDLGIVIHIDEEILYPMISEAIEVFWFDYKISFFYSLRDIEWFLIGKETSLWRIIN